MKSTIHIYNQKVKMTVKEIITKHQAATRFLTGQNSMRGHTMVAPGNLQTVIRNLEDFLSQKNINETEKILATSLLAEYQRMVKVSILLVSDGI